MTVLDARFKTQETMYCMDALVDERTLVCLLWRFSIGAFAVLMKDLLIIISGT
jgi:hypothetical protein